MTSTGRAVLAQGPGGVRLVGTSLPRVPGRFEVAVRMRYAPINPADLLVIDGRYAQKTGPLTPLGAEGVGEVDQVGAGITDLTRGQLVLPLTRGNWREHRTLAREELAPLPADLPVLPAQAAMLRINPATALLLLDAAEARSGEVIVQNGAGSAVAGWVRWIAARRGLTVLDVVRRETPALPEAILDGPDLAVRLRRAAEGRPITAGLDCVAGEVSGRIAEALSPRARLIIFGHLSGQPVTIASEVFTGSRLGVTGFSLRPAEAELGPAGVDRLFAQLFDWLRAAPPALPDPVIMPLSCIDEAIAVARARSHPRVVLDLAA